jgi:hypothetical protein
MTTREQGYVTAAMADLGFSGVPPEKDLGGKVIFEVTPSTLEKLKAGTRVIVDLDGTIQFEE